MARDPRIRPVPSGVRAVGRSGSPGMGRYTGVTNVTTGGTVSRGLSGAGVGPRYTAAHGVSNPIGRSR